MWPWQSQKLENGDCFVATLSEMTYGARITGHGAQVTKERSTLFGGRIVGRMRILVG